MAGRRTWVQAARGAPDGLRRARRLGGGPGEGRAGPWQLHTRGRRSDCSEREEGVEKEGGKRSGVCVCGRARARNRAREGPERLLAVMAVTFEQSAFGCQWTDLRLRRSY